MFRHIKSLLMPVGLIVGAILWFEMHEPTPVPSALALPETAATGPSSTQAPQARLAAVTSLSFSESPERNPEKPAPVGSAMKVSPADIHQAETAGPLVSPDEDTMERAAGYSQEGEEYLREGDSERAKEAFQEALDLIPNDSRASTGYKAAVAAETAQSADPMPQQDPEQQQTAIRPQPLAGEQMPADQPQ